jgi:UDP-N-acetylglucosamine 1-carboxyvinyltransferase
MAKLIIRGGNRLEGTVTLSGAKNSALKILCASVLTSEKIRLFNLPAGMEDIKVQIDMLRSLGAKVTIHNDVSSIDNSSISRWDVRLDCRKSIRTSLLLLGSLLGRFGRARVPIPGGCKIGVRKYDLHVYALECLGAKVRVADDDFLEAECDVLRGAEIEFPILTMGATENTIIAACLARGTTIIRNAYVTPEVTDLIAFLNGMGANVKARSSRTVEIQGVDELFGTNHRIILDRLEALTFMVAGGVTKGFVEIEQFPFELLEVPLIYLREAGVAFYKGAGSLIIDGRGLFSPIEIVGGSYPGIISDMQPLFAVFATQGTGISRIFDVRYPDRFGYVESLQKMGADIHREGNMAAIRGPASLKGARITAHDLREGTALLIAGLGAEGQTEIDNAYQIHRGYEAIDEKFTKLGADIERVADY